MSKEFKKKTFKVYPNIEYPWIKDFKLLKYMGGQTGVPSVIADLLVLEERDDSIYTVGKSPHADFWSLIMWYGGAVEIPHEVAEEIASWAKTSN